MSDGTIQQDEKKKRLIHRISRAGGQLNAVKTMIEDERPCKEIAMQLSAVRSALDKSYFEMMACAIELSMLGQHDREWQQDLEELTTTLVKYA